MAEDPRGFVPPYLGPRGWVRVNLDVSELDWEAVADLVESSYRLIARKRLVARLDQV